MTCCTQASPGAGSLADSDRATSTAHDNIYNACAAFSLISRVASSQIYIMTNLHQTIQHDNCTTRLTCSGSRQTSERGGQETWNISRRTGRPSFFGLFLQARGGGHGPLGPPPWIRYWLHQTNLHYDKSTVRQMYNTTNLQQWSTVVVLV